MPKKSMSDLFHERVSNEQAEKRGKIGGEGNCWTERTVQLMGTALYELTGNRWENTVCGHARFREHRTGFTVLVANPPNDKAEAAELARLLVPLADAEHEPPMHRIKCMPREPGSLPEIQFTETEECFTWRGQKLPMRSAISIGRMTPIQPLSERATAGRERMIAATLQMWSDGGGAMTRPFAERYVDGLAAEVGAMMATHLAVCAGWETVADRKSEPWTIICDESGQEDG